jgi:hypothetical protein
LAGQGLAETGLGLAPIAPLVIGKTEVVLESRVIRGQVEGFPVDLLRPDPHAQLIVVLGQGIGHFQIAGVQAMGFLQLSGAQFRLTYLFKIMSSAKQSGRICGSPREPAVQAGTTAEARALEPTADSQSQQGSQDHGPAQPAPEPLGIWTDNACRIPHHVVPSWLVAKK